ncbi:unnamed protein product [Sphagnum jensenii]|uniref:Armadillo repeat-containing protein 6 n=1 Tax=Sphagnum jensenii TaxID=128206 RepID=A0ABP0VQZ8_9BRYO
MNFCLDDQNRGRFKNSDGPQMVVQALALEDGGKVTACGAAAVAAAATRNEQIKEMFMDMGVDELLIHLLTKYAKDDEILHVACDAIRSLVTDDDQRPATSKVFRNAIRIVKGGAMDSILAAFLQQPKSSPLLHILCTTLKCLAVNDEICKEFSAQGGLDIMVQFFEYAILHGNRAMAKSVCALLRQLAKSDTNKEAIVGRGVLKQIITMMTKFPDDRAILQEAFVTVASLTLRSPANARKAVEAGAVDMAALIMGKYPCAAHLQRQGCQMLRNLAVRNPENRPVMIEKKLPDLIRKAKLAHHICYDVGAAALRDMGFDDYL